jgi:hypothetical protein
MAKWWWAIGGAMAGAVLAWIAAIFWMYLERSDFGTREPVYGGYWSIAAFGALILVSPPGAVAGGVVGYLMGRRLGRSETASSAVDASQVRGPDDGPAA